MSEQIDELIREIATKHGVVVSRDDPILVLQTINNRLLQDSAKAQAELLDQYKEELEVLALRWGTDSKEKAERILNASLAAAKDAMDKLMLEGVKATSASVTKDVEGALVMIDESIRNARRIAILNVFAAFLTAGAAGIALWAVLH